MRSLLLLLLVACPAPADEDEGGGSDRHADGVLAGFADADLTTHDGAWWHISAPTVFAVGYAPIAAFSMQTGDTACPHVEATDTTTTVTGDCTDQDGVTFAGEMRQDRSGVTYDDFTQTSTDADCGVEVSSTMTGTMALAASTPSRIPWTLDLVLTGVDVDADCVAADGTSAFSYEGTIAMSGDDADGDGYGDVSTWDGSGTVGESVGGRMDAATDGEDLDDAGCGSEAMRGTSTVSAGSHEIVYTYDGADDCDTGSTVTWTLDGVDQGEIAGITCATTGGSAAWLGVLAALVGLGRRRGGGRG